MGSQKRILITGGAGFIGSHLADFLIAGGAIVTVIDDISTGSEDNIAHLMAHDRFHYVEGSVLDEIIMKKLIDNCDEVYHLAAAVGVKYIIDNPIKSISINTRGTEIVLALASIEKKKVLITSSSEVYGKNPSAVFPESADSILGATKISRWSYACTKALDEFLAFAYYQEKKTPVIVVRLFNTVGPRQSDRYGMVIPRFITQALHNLPITVYGDGEQTRSFIYVGDVVEGIVASMSHPDAVGDVFNIGNPHGVTILELAHKIKEKTRSSSEIVRIPYNQAYGEGFEDMQYRVPDITKIYNLIGFVPRISLDEILDKTIQAVRAKQ